jgi:nicotinate-nucleotide pyrophosphorylase (carboxylating)
MAPRGSRERSVPVRRTAERALAEDRWRRDVTSRAVVPAALRATGRVSAQGTGVLSGLDVAEAVARAGGLRVRRRARDGERVRPGTVVLELSGSARELFAVERTVLNFLMHLSGVASATAEARRAIGADGPEVYATRKTLPGLRDLEKAAVRHAGGRPHRRDLSDGILLKTNHLALVPLRTAVERARQRSRGRRVQVEVRTTAEALAAVDAGADALLIDNATPAKARAIVRALAASGRRSGVHIELSGGITPANVAGYRTTGADAVSLGSLTHSALALPFHMSVVPHR